MSDSSITILYSIEDSVIGRYTVESYLLVETQ